MKIFQIILLVTGSTLLLFIGFLFRIMHWPLGKEIQFIGLFSILVSLFFLIYSIYTRVMKNRIEKGKEI